MPDLADEEVVASIAASLDALDDPEFVKTGELTAALAGKAAADHNHSGTYQPSSAALTAVAGAAANTLIGRGPSGAVAALTAAALGEDTAPGSGDMLVGFQASTGALVKFDAGNFGDDAIEISDVTGLTDALAGKSATSHNHDSAYAAASHNHSGTYEPLLVEYSVYAASDSSSTAADAYVVVPFSHESRAASGFSVSSGEVTIPSAGTYRVEYDILGEYTTASTKGRCPFNLQSNVSGDWASVAHALAELCHGGSSSTTLYQRPMCHGWGYVTTTGANQKIRVYGGPVQNEGSALTLKAYACRLRVTKVG